jgi:uncharacterized protein YcbK (DUF882 family)
MQLTPNFTLEELTHTDHRTIDNVPNSTEINNLKRVAELLEVVRVVLNNKFVMINSGFRCKELNDAVGSKDTSQHRLGCAADIRVSGLSPDQVVQAIKNSPIQFDQLIREFDSWTHISVPNEPFGMPRKQVLIIDKQGTRTYS